MDFPGDRVLAHVRRAAGLRDGDDPRLTDDPGEGDLRGGRAATLGHGRERHVVRSGEQALLDR